MRFQLHSAKTFPTDIQDNDRANRWCSGTRITCEETVGRLRGVDEGDRCAFMTQVGYLGGSGVSQRVQVISMSRSAQKSAI